MSQQRGSFDIEQSAILPPGRKFLFGIGINDYQHLRPLRNAVKDLEDLATLLLERYDFEESGVKLLKNEQATRKNIINTLHSFTNSTLLRTDDSLLIYFSGHGILDDNQEGYWVPVESEPDDIDSFIPNETVKSKIKNMKCRHVLLISDSCFSGSLLSRDVSALDDNIVAESLESMQSRWIITSGGRNESVQDGVGSNSPFAEAILSELRYNLQPKLLTDKLALRIRDITRANAPQMPQAEKLYGTGDLGGRFVFNLRDREADDWKSALVVNTRPVFESFCQRYPKSNHFAEATERIAALTELAAWESACRTDTRWAYLDFIESYPQSLRLNQACQKVAEVEDQQDWNRAKATRTLSAYLDYRTKHPAGKFREEANSEIVKLRKQDEAERTRFDEDSKQVAAEKQIQKDDVSEQDKNRLKKNRQKKETGKKESERIPSEEQNRKQPERLQPKAELPPLPVQSAYEDEPETVDAEESYAGTTRNKYIIGGLTVLLILISLYFIIGKKTAPQSSVTTTIPADSTAATDSTAVPKNDEVAEEKTSGQKKGEKINNPPKVDVVAKKKKAVQIKDEEIANPPKEEDPPKEDPIFTVVEQNPEFPGGMAALAKFLSNNTRYPTAASRANVSGRVFVSFVVNADGSIQDARVVKSLGFGTDEEALRIVNSMPKWQPGKQSGRPARVRYNLPINFLLE